MIKIKWKYVFMIMLLLIILSACKKENEILDEKVPIEDDAIEDDRIEENVEEKKQRSPLSGIYVEKEKLDRRIIGIMFDNHPKARWQSGLKDAEIVYEYPVEAPYTRYLALFLSNDPESIGPIRSARPYFVTNILEYNALYVRCGGSREADADIIEYNIDELDARVSGTDIFWRKDHKKSPNNLYTDMKTLRTLAQQKGLNSREDKETFSFSREDRTLEGFLAREININYNTSNTTDYLYNEEDGRYYRKKDGKDHIDETDNSPITTKNIIIREVDIRPLANGKKLEIDLVGKGKGKYFTNGRGININWTKNSREEKTIYTNESGNELKLNPGNTFIQVVSPKMETKIKE